MVLFGVYDAVNIIIDDGWRREGAARGRTVKREHRGQLYSGCTVLRLKLSSHILLLALNEIDCLTEFTVVIIVVT